MYSLIPHSSGLITRFLSQLGISAPQLATITVSFILFAKDALGTTPPTSASSPTNTINNDPETIIRLSQEAFNEPDKQKSLALFDEIIKLSPKNIGLHFGKAHIHQRLGQHDKAIEIYDNMLKVALSSPPKVKAPIYFHKGHSLANLGRYQEAAENYDTAHRLGFKSSTFYKHSSFVQIKLQNYNKAIKYLHKALKQDPHDNEANMHIGVLHIKQGNYKQSINFFKQALKNNPQDIDAHILLGAAYQGVGNLKDALKSYSNAEIIAPNHPLVKTSLKGTTEKSLNLELLKLVQAKLQMINTHTTGTNLTEKTQPPKAVQKAAQETAHTAINNTNHSIYSSGHPQFWEQQISDNTTTAANKSK